MSYYSFGYINSDNDLYATGYWGYNYFIIDASANNINIILPPNFGAAYVFNRIDQSTHVVTLTCQTGDTINGNSSLVFPINTYSEAVYNNFNGATNWLIPKFSFTL